MACDPNALANLAKCFACLSDKQRAEVQTYLLCQIQANGGTGSGGTQYFSGSGAPTNQVPTSNAGAYYDYTNKITYNWNPTLNGGAGGWE
jgi:hypothetical protein